MLFLTHLAHKMRPAHEGGGRAGIVLNGSPLFNGGAESGPSDIRRWLLENDLVEAIVALPTDMFFNTGIATYIWLLDNTKSDQRRSKVQLIDASAMGTKMRKSLGSKRKEISEEARAKIVGLYDAFTDSDPDVSKVFNNTDFGVLDDHRRTAPAGRRREPGHRPEGQAEAGHQEEGHRERPLHVRRQRGR